ncbi:N-acetyltransferase [Dictyobacter vulcani]|uniref:N-acetyltransferase n=1 Tax=Dictyobacter vulcani TaxID=2607529 RepID=A0A5J4KXK4_9CHLR|nr:GNAT family N-acetyltransferase [Dictyobacter vulcani]GER92243.1 N-acetyltransferase [Dictyobacter vulcani]
MVILRPMAETEFQAYLEPAIQDYAQNIFENGTLTEAQALERSRQQYGELLPQGLASPRQYLFTLVEPEQQQSVGILWFAIEERPGRAPYAFVYDIRINDAHQRHGYGSQAFQEMEKKVRELGINQIALHVFGSNTGALEMYKKLGYISTDVNMAKTLDPA